MYREDALVEHVLTTLPDDSDSWCYLSWMRSESYFMICLWLVACGDDADSSRSELAATEGSGSTIEPQSPSDTLTTTTPSVTDASPQSPPAEAMTASTISSESTGAESNLPPERLTLVVRNEYPSTIYIGANAPPFDMVDGAEQVVPYYHDCGAALCVNPANLDVVPGPSCGGGLVAGSVQEIAPGDTVTLTLEAVLEQRPDLLPTDFFDYPEHVDHPGTCVEAIRIPPGAYQVSVTYSLAFQSGQGGIGQVLAPPLLEATAEVSFASSTTLELVVQ